LHLGAEKTAKDYKITRQEQDAYALISYDRATKAWKNGEYQAEIVPVPVKQRRGPDLIVSEDEEYKRLVREKVPSLPASFVKDGTGTITAANASSLNDGAAAVLTVSGEFLNKSALTPVAKIVGYAEAGRAPVDFTVAPVNAVQNVQYYNIFLNE
jgi:acetyl-CoA C-acetyltransferase